MKIDKLDALKQLNAASNGDDIWLNVKISKTPALNRTLYAITGYIEKEMGFPCGVKRANLLLAHLMDCHFREQYYWDNKAPAYCAISLDKNRYSVPNTKTSNKTMKAIKRDIKNAFFKLDEIKDTINKLEYFGYIFIIGGATGRTTRITPTNKLKEMFENPPEPPKTFSAKQACGKELTKECYVPVTIKDSNKRSITNITGESRDMERIRNIMLKAMEVTWNTDQTFTLELTDDLIDEAEDSECDYLLRLLNSATVVWSTSEERSDDTSDTGESLYTFSKENSMILPFTYAEKPNEIRYMDASGVARLFLRPGSYNLTKMLTYKVVFNNGKITDGGRIYSAVQNIPKVFREGFRINGKKLVSVDLVSSHPRMLCHMEGFEMKDDMYSFATGLDLTRKEIKRNVNSALNDSNPRKIRMRDPVIFSFAEAHPRLKKYLWSGVGVKLQAFEGKIARSLLNKWTNQKGKIFVCIHDGYMIEEEHAEEFCNDIKRFYKSINELNGFEPVLEIKQASPETLCEGF